MAAKNPNSKAEQARKIASKYNVALSTAKYWMTCNLSQKDMEYRRQRLNKGVEARNIEGMHLDDVVKKFGISMTTANGYRRAGLSLRQVEIRSQMRNGTPHEKKTYDGETLGEISKRTMLGASIIIKMAHLGVRADDMPKYLEDHPEVLEDKPKKERKKARKIATGEYLTEYEIHRKEIAEKNNVMLARKI